MSSSAESLPPLVAEVAAPVATVFELLSLRLPSAIARLLPDETPQEHLAAIDSDTPVRWHSIERVIAQPPDCVTYELVRGPCARLERRFFLRERGGNTRVLAEMRWTPGGLFNRKGGQKQVIQATRQLLANMQQQAERLAHIRPLENYKEAQPTVREPSEEVPAFLQRRLLVAVEQQELQEWQGIGHGMGTARYVAVLCEALALPDDLCQTMQLAGILHDVGKVKIEPELFDRTATLSATGQRRIDQHPRLGAAMVTGLPGADILVPAIRHHHERWDGAGYPDSLQGERIPLAARIVSVAEAADAMQRPLPERRARTTLEVAAILSRHAGRQWDPDLAQILVRLLTREQPPQIQEPTS